jgi:hypothetical protein
MALQNAVAAIRGRIESLWPEPAVGLTWPNENFSLPSADDGTPQSWMLVEIRWNPMNEGSIGSPGSNLARRFGHIWFYAFVPQGSGESRCHQLLSEAAAIFENADFNNVVCEGFEPGGQAETENGNFFGLAGAVPFWFDEYA